MANQSPIFVKTEMFMLWVLHHVQKFPREERFRLAARMEQVLFTFHPMAVWLTPSIYKHIAPPR